MCRIPVRVSLLVGATSLAAQTNWQQQQISIGEQSGRIAYDSVRDRLVLVTTSDTTQRTMEFDGTSWAVVPTSVTPPPPIGIVYDSVRRVTVAFVSGSAVDTWEWDGTVWTPRAVTAKPPSRTTTTVAFDSTRGRAVLFGGNSRPGTDLGDTWEWDGSQWRSVTTPIGPLPRYGASMAFDAVRGRIVLFGGAAGSSYLGDTWEFDGSAWTQFTPTTAPAAQSFSSMAFDPRSGRVVLFGVSELWTWSGANWQGPVTTPVPPRTGADLVLDSLRGRLILHGGVRPGVLLPLRDFWALSASTWVALPLAAPQGLTARAGAAAAFDVARNRLVLFGGTHKGGISDEHWEFDGTTWARILGQRPPARSAAAMVYDSRRRRCVLYGEAAGSPVWEWDGSVWSPQPSSNQPEQTPVAMAFDEARGVTVFVGGLFTIGGFGGSRHSRTVLWDGQTWVEPTLTTYLSYRGGHALAYDAERRQVVMYGGGGASDIGNTWLWDGTSWTSRQTAVSPGPRAGHRMVYDSARKRVVLFGDQGPATDTWEWDGTSWSSRQVSSMPGPRTLQAMAYDPARGRTILIGGLGYGFAGILGDAWSYQPTVAANVIAYGAGCAGTAGLPVLTVPDLPWLGDQTFAVVSPVIPGQLVRLYVGASDRTLGGMSLPLDLAPFGMPGCSLLASLEGCLATAASGTSTQFALAVPNNPGLLGMSVYGQAMLFDPAANPAGAVMTQAVRFRFGAR